jgi:hypothetical protein
VLDLAASSRHEALGTLSLIGTCTAPVCRLVPIALNDQHVLLQGDLDLWPAVKAAHKLRARQARAGKITSLALPRRTTRRQVQGRGVEAQHIGESARVRPLSASLTTPCVCPEVEPSIVLVASPVEQLSEEITSDPSKIPTSRMMSRTGSTEEGPRLPPSGLLGENLELQREEISPSDGGGESSREGTFGNAVDPPKRPGHRKRRPKWALTEKDVSRCTPDLVRSTVKYGRSSERSVNFYHQKAAHSLGQKGRRVLML